MNLIAVFTVGGLLCAIFQGLWQWTNAKPGTLLTIGFIISAVLTPLGITGKLASLGGRGFSLMVVGAGEAAYSGTITALEGNIFPILELVFVFLSIIVIGTASGYLREKCLARKAENK